MGHAENHFKNRYLTLISRVLTISILLSSVLLLCVISVEILYPYMTPSMNLLFLKVQFWVCVNFMTDFFFRLFTSPQKWRYLATHWLYFLVSIPFVNIAQHTHLQLSDLWYMILKVIPLLRGAYGLIIVINWLTRNRVTGIMISYVVMMLAFVWFSSLIFFSFERPVNPLVKTFWDSLWWATMNATTVGSEIVPRTAIGRILSVSLAVFGMLLFPIFTVYMTDKLQINFSSGGRSSDGDGTRESNSAVALPQEGMGAATQKLSV